MPIIDLDTGEEKNEKPQGPMVVDLETGELVPANQPTQKSQVEQPVNQGNKEDALKILNDNIGAFESFAIATGRGMTDILRFAGLADSEPEIVKQGLEDLGDKRPITQTIGRAVGQAAPFLPAGVGVAAIPSMTARLPAAIGLGAGEGYAISKGMEQDESQNTNAAVLGGTIAGGLELAFPVIGRIARPIINKVFGRNPSAPVVNKLGEPSKELEEALKRSNMTFDDIVNAADGSATGVSTTAQQKAREKLLREAGITNPTQAQLSGDVSDFQKQQELFKVSGPVRSTIEQQDDQLMGGFNRALTQTGRPSSNMPYNAVVNFVEQKSLAKDAAINSAYTSARDLTNDSKVIKPQKLVEKLRSIAGTETASGGVYSAVKGFLREKGIVTKKLNDNAFIDATTAESLRQDINSLYNSVTPLGRQKLRELKDALDEDVLNYAGDDAFQTARKMKADFEKELTRTKSTKFDARNKEFLRDILENKYNPDTFFNDAILAKSTRSSDVEQLKRYLTSDASGDAIEAWNSVRADSVEWIRDNAFNDVNGVYALSAKKLESALNRIGRDKMRVLFTPEERQFFQLMQTVANIREPARGTALGQGPSAQAVKSLYNSLTNNSIIYDVFKSMKVNADARNMLSINPPIESLRTVAPAAQVGAVGLATTPPEQKEQQQ